MSTRRLILVITTTAVVLSGCRDPFATHEDEYGRVAHEQQLRHANVLPLDDAAIGEPEEDLSQLWRQRPADLYEDAEPKDVSIEQCRAWTLENNLDLKVALIDPTIADTFISEEEGRFNAVFLANASVSDASPSRAEVFRDLFVRPFEFNPGFSIPLRTGGTLGVTMPLSERATIGSPEFDARRYAADLDLTISQPLLRNAGRRTNTHFIRIAAIDSQIVQARTKLEVIRQIAAVDRAYWLLHAANQRYIVRRQQYDRAREQLLEADARFQRGLGPQIEVFRASAGVSRRLESIFLAELRVKDQQRGLKRIINLPGIDVDSPVMLVLSSKPNPVRYDLDRAELIAAAMKERMELLELELQLAQDLSTIDFTQNQKLPLFALDYLYRIQGVGSSMNDAFGNFGDEWGWRLRLNAEVPLGNDVAESRYHRAILSRLQRLATRSAREQAIKLEVLGAADNLEVTWQRILAAMTNVQLQSRNYDAEKRQFRLGNRNSTDVLIAEDRYSEAMVSEIIATVDYEIAQTDVAFSTGMLLGAARISW